jgi:hypothetical protein
MSRSLWPSLTIALCLAALFPTTLLASRQQPHDFMSDVNSCAKCHDKVPVPGQDDFTTIVLKKDIVTLCEECHQAMVQSDKHPVDIRPDRTVPADMHLDNYFSITCTTCHDPHGQPFAEYPYVTYTLLDQAKRLFNGEKEHRTYFLRRSNVDGELCLSCHTVASLINEVRTDEVVSDTEYVGSGRCRECHRGIHEQWEQSLHSRYVGDPKKDPGVLLATFDGDKPFPKDKILFTLGAHWTQRYVVKGPADPLVVPDIWSIQSKSWLNAGTYNRSWYRFCAGCHTTGFNPFKGTFVEAGIGCEGCHGPGKTHCETSDPFDIVNPARLTESRRDMICESCHTSGHDRSGLYRFPVGYRPGDDLTKFYKGLVPKPGQEADTYTGDGTYEDRHRQYDYWMARYNITTGILCDVCKNFRQRPEGASDEIFLSSSEFCATCHVDTWKGYKAHSGHTSEQAGCIDCHTPALSRDRKGYSIHDHKFQFGPPVRDEEMTMEKRCESCHTARKVNVSPASVAARAGAALGSKGKVR